MRQLIKQNIIAAVSLILALPAAYFIGISLLKFQWGIDAPFDTAAPTLDRLGIHESPGWNINLLILFGPLVAVLLMLFQLLSIRLQFTQNHFLLQVLVKKKWLPLLVAAFSATILGIVFIYLLAENCV